MPLGTGLGIAAYVTAVAAWIGAWQIAKGRTPLPPHWVAVPPAAGIFLVAALCLLAARQVTGTIIDIEPGNTLIWAFDRLTLPVLIATCFAMAGAWACAGPFMLSRTYRAGRDAVAAGGHGGHGGEGGAGGPGGEKPGEPGGAGGAGGSGGDAGAESDGKPGERGGRGGAGGRDPGHPGTTGTAGRDGADGGEGSG